MPLVACEDVRTPLGALRVVFGIGHLQILRRAARAAPEGYTAGIGNTSAVYPVQYGVLKDFEAVSLLTNTCAALSTWDQGRDCGTAEIQRIAENAPSWPDIHSLVRPSSAWPSSYSPCAILVWLEAL